MKKDILDSTDTMSKLANLNVLNKDNHKLASSIDIGFAAKGTLTNLAKKSSVSDRVLLEFRNGLYQVPSLILPANFLSDLL